MPDILSRRSFLTRSALIGCSAAASPLLTPVSFAAAPWDTRLVVIILRGGMDGLDVLRPYGDPDFAGLRPQLARRGDPAIDLDGFFALHPELAPLMPMWRAGELGFVNAVSTPYRNKRSHFDGQDLLEAGTATLDGARDGWLNRMLQLMPGVETETAYAIGRSEMHLLKGSAQVADWTPEADLTLSPQASRLLDLVMEQDPAFHAAFSEAQILSASGRDRRDTGKARRARAHQKIAAFAADKLNGAARVAAFSINGWDTHNRQARSISSALRRLSDTLLTLRSDIVPTIWQKTAIICMTEFGRTARENGTRGTDHGTGGAMVLAGGAVRGGYVHGDWPGLGATDLLEGRDLMPTRDVRAHAGWIIRGLTGLDRAAVESTIFPGVELGDAPNLLL